MRRTYTVIQVNSTDVAVTGHPAPEQQMSYTLDPSKYAAARDEIRIRCVAHNTAAGIDQGQQTGVTAGFPVQIRSGTGGDVWQHHNLTGYVDAHGWYSRGVQYDYAIFDNAAALTSHPLSGIVNVNMHGFARFGATVQDHHRILVDGVQVAEFHGTTESRTVALDTRKLTNGTHTLAIHSHAVEVNDPNRSDEQPGKQIAGQVEVTITVQN